MRIISKSLFVSADTALHSHAASQYHVRPKAKHGIVVVGINPVSTEANKS